MQENFSLKHFTENIPKSTKIDQTNNNSYKSEVIIYSYVSCFLWGSIGILTAHS